MPLSPTALAEAKGEANRLYRNVTALWGHLTNTPNGGPMTAANLVAGVNNPNTQTRLIEIQGDLARVRPNLVRWGALKDYNPQFVNNVVFWSVNLQSEITRAANKPGGRSPTEVLELIRGTLNFVIDPYNFEVFVKLTPYRGR
jgi:hypothetical protein